MALGRIISKNFDDNRYHKALMDSGAVRSAVSTMQLKSQNASVKAEWERLLSNAEAKKAMQKNGEGKKITDLYAKPKAETKKTEVSTPIQLRKEETNGNSPKTITNGDLDPQIKMKAKVLPIAIRKTFLELAAINPDLRFSYKTGAISAHLRGKDQESGKQVHKGTIDLDGTFYKAA